MTCLCVTSLHIYRIYISYYILLVFFWAFFSMHTFPHIIFPLWFQKYMTIHSKCFEVWWIMGDFKDLYDQYQFWKDCGSWTKHWWISILATSPKCQQNVFYHFSLLQAFVIFDQCWGKQASAHSELHVTFIAILKCTSPKF